MFSSLLETSPSCAGWALLGGMNDSDRYIYVRGVGWGNNNSCRCATDLPPPAQDGKKRESSFSGQHRDGRKYIFHFVARPRLNGISVTTRIVSNKDRIFFFSFLFYCKRRSRVCVRATVAFLYNPNRVRLGREAGT